jgi:hypothetical protein
VKPQHSAQSRYRVRTSHYTKTCRTYIYVCISVHKQINKVYIVRSDAPVINCAADAFRGAGLGDFVVPSDEQRKPHHISWPLTIGREDIEYPQAPMSYGLALRDENISLPFHWAGQDPKLGNELCFLLPREC